jgi:hypothetical protein
LGLWCHDLCAGYDLRAGHHLCAEVLRGSRPPLPSDDDMRAEDLCTEDVL